MSLIESLELKVSLTIQPASEMEAIFAPEELLVEKNHQNETKGICQNRITVLPNY